MKLSSRLDLGVGILALLTPLGMLIPRAAHSGSAWGEWSVEEAAKLAGYCPEGLRRLSGIWHAPLPNYTLGSAEGAHAYLVSGLAGAAAVILAAFLIARILGRKNE